MENKQEFVKSLEACLKLSREFSDLRSLEYVKKENEEYVYLIYKGCQKRICVTGDSCFGILTDFVNRYNSTPYILDDNLKYL
jgi:hypothetical protein